MRPHNGEFQRRGGVRVERTTSVLTPHRVLSGPPQGPSFPSSGPLPPKGAWVPAPEADLGGLEPSSDPAFVFSSQKNNNRGSDGAKDCLEPRGERRPQPPPGGALRGSAAGGGGEALEAKGEKGKAGARGLRLTDGRAGGGWAARGPHRGSSKRTKAKGTRPCRFLSSISLMRPYL